MGRPGRRRCYADRAAYAVFRAAFIGAARFRAAVDGRDAFVGRAARFRAAVDGRDAFVGRAARFRATVDGRDAFVGRSRRRAALVGRPGRRGRYADRAAHPGVLGAARLGHGVTGLDARRARGTRRELASDALMGRGLAR
ncbi:hypothetical protein ABT369_45195 [Dactylosporangium sp. NPDC000244]|uniref:hypothetical protein n=1 Tax=Dactylosporangium sp. NPDC000244 TaxID=3154365 RepID=UPI0033247CF4